MFALKKSFAIEGPLSNSMKQMFENLQAWNEPFTVVQNLWTFALIRRSGMLLDACSTHTATDQP